MPGFMSSSVAVAIRVGLSGCQASALILRAELIAAAAGALLFRNTAISRL